MAYWHASQLWLWLRPLTFIRLTFASLTLASTQPVPARHGLLACLAVMVVAPAAHIHSLNVRFAHISLHPTSPARHGLLACLAVMVVAPAAHIHSLNVRFAHISLHPTSPCSAWPTGMPR